MGHSDIEGAATDNRALALERAMAARAAFETHGVMGMQVESAGEMCPVADTESAAGRRLNRRVEIWVRSAPQGAAHLVALEFEDLSMDQIVALSRVIDSELVA